MPVPILQAGFRVDARRKFFALADVEAPSRRTARGSQRSVLSPLCLEAVQRIDALFDIDCSINGLSAEQSLAARQASSAPLVADLQTWMGTQRAKLSGGNEVAKAMDYMLKRWAAFAPFLEDVPICLTNNATERALRCIALVRKSSQFAGSDRGGQRTAIIYSLIVTAKMNDFGPQAWLAHEPANITQHTASQLDALLPWNWQPQKEPANQAA